MANKPTLKTTTHRSKKNIDFVLVRKQVKNIGLKVKTTGVVQVTAHTRVPLDYIMNLVDEKSEWINKHLDRFKDYESTSKPRLPITYTNGDVLSYLGKEYVLVLNYVEENTKMNNVYITDEKIYLNVNKEATEEKRARAVEKWYKDQCTKIFEEILNEQFEIVKGYILGETLMEKPNFKLRKMKSCWGVCHYTKSQIVLNTELIKYDRECIVYVVLHELMHFKHPNHSKDFYNALGYFMPNYKEVKNKLKTKSI